MWVCIRRAIHTIRVEDGVFLPNWDRQTDRVSIEMYLVSATDGNERVISNHFQVNDRRKRGSGLLFN